MRLALATLAFALLLGAALSAATPLYAAPADQQTLPGVQGRTIARKPVTDTLRGTVESVDERNDDIIIRLSPGTTEQFKVQDGLIFNAVRYGDQVDITVQTIAGAKTIVRLSKE